MVFGTCGFRSQADSVSLGALPREITTSTIPMEPVDVQPVGDDVAPEFRPGKAIHQSFWNCAPPDFPLPQQRDPTRLLCAVLGAKDVGKKSLMKRFGYFPSFLDPTDDGDNYVSYSVDGEAYQVELHLVSHDLWMTEPLAITYHRSATIVAYSVTSASSLGFARSILQLATSYRLPDQFVTQPSGDAVPVTGVDIRNPPPPHPILLLGLKSDDTIGREVTRADGERLAREHGCIFAEASPRQKQGAVAAVAALVEAAHRLEKACSPPRVQEGPGAMETRKLRIALWLQWVLSTSTGTVQY